MPSFLSQQEGTDRHTMTARSCPSSGCLVCLRMVPVKPQRAELRLAQGLVRGSRPSTPLTRDAGLPHRDGR